MKEHRTRTGHNVERDEMVTKTSKTDVITEKRKQIQNLLSKVWWGEEEVENN